MQVQELLNNKLEREYAITIPAKEINSSIEAKAVELAKTAKLDGFRVGKVPVSVIKQRYKDSIISEILDNLINTTSQQIISDNKLKLATRPNVSISSFNEGKDLEYKVKFELYPEIPELDFSQYSLEELICDIQDKDIEQALTNLRKAKQDLKSADSKAIAKEGDTVVIDFTGYIDGKEFQGGKGENYKLELGANQFIPGFEAGLVGMKAGKSTKLDLKFPKDYGMKEFDGKKVTFEVTVKEILNASLPELNDDFAKSFGLQTLEELKKAIKADLEKRYAKSTHTLMKKALFDILDEKVTCELPKSMVEKELENLNKQLSNNNQEKDKDLDAKTKSKYQKIAQRRVKLGLLLSEIAQKNKLSITQDDIRNAIINYAQSMPGQEQLVIEYFNKNPQAIENLKGPITEDKAVQFIISKTKNKQKHVTIEKLLELIQKSEEDNAIV